MGPQYSVGVNVESIIDFLRCGSEAIGLEPYRCTLHMYISQARSKREPSKLSSRSRCLAIVNNNQQSRSPGAVL